MNRFIIGSHFWLSRNTSYFKEYMVIIMKAAIVPLYVSSNTLSHSLHNLILDIELRILQAYLNIKTDTSCSCSTYINWQLLVVAKLKSNMTWVQWFKDNNIKKNTQTILSYLQGMLLYSTLFYKRVLCLNLSLKGRLWSGTLFPSHSIILLPPI